MSTRDEHTAQANHNRSFWGSLDVSTTEFIDWVVIGVFYEAVHWVEAVLATKTPPIHSGTHGNRTAHMLRYQNEFSQVQPDFDVLKVESENARYHCFKHTPEQVTNDLIPMVDNIAIRLRPYLGN